MNINDITKELIDNKKIPKVRPGDIVHIVSESGEGGKQIFEGVVIAVSGGGISKTLKVRRVAAGVGVEKIYPLYSPTIKKIQIKKSSKVRRAKLYWLRERSGRGTRLTEKDLDPEVVKLMKAEEEEKTEEVGEVSKPKTESKPSKDSKAERVSKKDNKLNEAKSAVAKGEGGEKSAEKSKKPKTETLPAGRQEPSKAEPKEASSDSKDKS